MSTFADMVNEVQMSLYGYTVQQDRSTYLTAAVTSTSQLSLSLASSENLGSGVIEINDELLYVDTYDRLSNTANIAPYGRGYLGTTPATALLNDKVTISPTFPRFAVKRAINDTINAIGSQLPILKSTTFTSNVAVSTYAFGNLNINSVISLAFQTVGPSKTWQPLKAWRFDSNGVYSGFSTYADTGSTPVSTDQVQTITIAPVPFGNRTVQMVYYGTPTVLSLDADVFTTVTGFTQSVKDVVIYGAMYRLLAALDPAKSGATSPQADETDSRRPAGSDNSNTKQVYALYKQRLMDEIKNQQAQNSIRIHRLV